MGDDTKFEVGTLPCGVGGVRSKMGELKLCMELNEVLFRSRKCVEDDTCLDRVLSGIKGVLTRDGEKFGTGDCASGVETLARFLTELASESSEHPPSTLGFMLRLTSIILPYADLHVENTRLVLNSVVLFPLSEDAQYSISNSWLCAIRNLISNMEQLTGISYSNLIIRVIELTCSPSVFIYRQATECLAEIGVHLHNLQSLKVQCLALAKQKFRDIFVGDKSLPVVKQIAIATKMLLTSYDVAMHVLSSLPLAASLQPQQSVLALCKNGDVVLCHFFEALYCEQLENFPSNTIADLVADNSAFYFATTSMIHCPTKVVGWKMLSAFVTYNHPSPEVDCGLSMIISTFDDSEPYMSMGGCLLDHKKEWHDKIQSILCHSLVMSRILCHTFNSISSIIRYKKSNKLINSLSCFVKVLNNYFHSDADSSVASPVVRTVFESHNAMTALLKCLDTNCSQFLEHHFDCLRILISNVMTKPSLHHSVVQLCHKLALSILATKYCEDFVATCVSAQLNHFIDRRWEIRDSSLEFLSSLLMLDEEICPDKTSLSAIYSKHNVHNECTRLCKDSSSFVRAAAVTLVGILATKNLFSNINEPIKLSADILSSDIESPPRRAAVLALLKCMKENNDFLNALCFTVASEPMPHSMIAIEKITEEIHRAFYGALFEDLDWEVKYNAIDILALLIKHEKSVSKSELLCSKLRSTLHKMLNDYDDTVREKALVLYNSTYGSPASERDLKCDVESELHALLLEILASLQHEKPHSSDHSLSETSEAEDTVILDCY